MRGGNALGKRSFLSENICRKSGGKSNRSRSSVRPVHRIGKINDIYRKVLYLKTEKYDTLVKMKNRLEQYIEINSGYQKIRIQFDFDPMHLLEILEKMQEQQVEQ